MSSTAEKSPCTGCIPFVFETRYKTYEDKHCLAISGSLDKLGKWSIQEALLAEEIPPKSGRWLAAVELPVNTSFEWKLALIDKDRSNIYRWEERPNRTLYTGNCQTHVRVVWNLGEELEIPLRHKFKQIGTIHRESESEEELSYLPSGELLQRLYGKNNGEDKRISESPSSERVKTCLNAKVLQSKCHENLEQSDQNIENNTQLINDQSKGLNQSPQMELISVKEDISNRFIYRIRDWFCTVL